MLDTYQSLMRYIPLLPSGEPELESSPCEIEGLTMGRCFMEWKTSKKDPKTIYDQCPYFRKVPSVKFPNAGPHALGAHIPISLLLGDELIGMISSHRAPHVDLTLEMKCDHGIVSILVDALCYVGDNKWEVEIHNDEENHSTTLRFERLPRVILSQMFFSIVSASSEFELVTVLCEPSKGQRRERDDAE